MKSKNKERLLKELVDSGEMEVTEAGVVLRVTSKGKPLPHPRVSAVRQKSGYLTTWGQVRGVRLLVLIHRLVWQVIHGDIPDDKEVNHINGVKSDNRPENLELVTKSGNMTHAHRTGLSKATEKLTEDLVVRMREKYASSDFKSVSKLATEFGVSKATARSVVRGKTWRWVGGPVFSGNLLSLTHRRKS